MAKFANYCYFVAQLLMAFAFTCKKCIPAWDQLKKANLANSFMQGLDGEPDVLKK